MKDYYIDNILAKLACPDIERASVKNTLRNLDKEDVATVCVVVAAENITDPFEVEKIVKNLNKYFVELSVHNERDLGEFWIRCVCLNKNSDMNRYKYYIDRERLAKDLLATGIGEITPYGMLWYADWKGF